MAFYGAIFGWTFQKWDGPIAYWMATTGPKEEPGINGGVMPRQHPNQPCVNTTNVPDLDATQSLIEANGGVCTVPKMPIPGVGWLAYFKDLDGHIFGVMQIDAGAAA
jgi:predicted enzyme related to lactoylglutathione lyase